MSDKVEAAHILFPNDAPREAGSAPDWFVAATSQAEARLSRRIEPEETLDIDNPAGEETNQDDEAKVRNEAEMKVTVGAFLDTYKRQALQDDEPERAAALDRASDALVTDALKFGTPQSDLREAFELVRVDASRLAAPTPQEAADAWQSAMREIGEEYGSGAEAKLAAARAMVRDIEMVSPGFIDTLERSGSGSNPRFIKLMIKEAARRGYR